MVARAILLLLVICLVSLQTARAENAPILPGSFLRIDQAVAKSEFVFEAKLTRAGTLDNENAAKYLGPTYTGGQAGGLSYYKGHAPDPVHLTISLNESLHETIPVVGQNYLFFVQGPRAGGEYFVMKMLPARMENRRVSLRAVMTEQMQQKHPERPQHEPTAAQ